jgi:general secretion pathway protein E
MLSVKQFVTRELKISEDLYMKSVEDARRRNRRVLPLLVENGLVGEETLARRLAEALGLPVLDLEAVEGRMLPVEGVSVEFMREHHLVVYREVDGDLVNAMADPFDSWAAGALARLLGTDLRVLVGTFSQVDEAIEQLYGRGASSLERIVDGIDDSDYAAAEADQDAEQLLGLASEAPVVRLVNLIITNAIKAAASDIHFEPFENRFRVRYRIDGVLSDIESPPKHLQAAVISRVKIMAKLDIAERRLPQDGRIRLKVMGKDVDFRVSTLPTSHGESVVLRILDRESSTFELERLGLPSDILARFNRIIHYPYGMILVTGPTGSGKTTTLYGALSRLNSVDKKIITIEDPVEYEIEGVNQMQVRPKIGLTFATGLRSIVRQDPDIILVGEIRDPETAEIAIQSALTGHLVFSTLHTNDSAGAVARLLEMGVESYLLSSSLLAVMAQRLVRIVCEECKEERPLPRETYELLGLDETLWPWSPELTYHQGRGCKTCNHTGFRGRSGIFEFFEVDEDMRELVAQRVPTSVLRRKARDKGLKTLREAGWEKVLQGLTTVDEVLRVTIQE